MKEENIKQFIQSYINDKIGYNIYNDFESEEVIKVFNVFNKNEGYIHSKNIVFRKKVFNLFFTKVSDSYIVGKKSKKYTINSDFIKYVNESIFEPKELNLKSKFLTEKMNTIWNLMGSVFYVEIDKLNTLEKNKIDNVYSLFISNGIGKTKNRLYFKNRFFTENEKTIKESEFYIDGAYIGRLYTTFVRLPKVVKTLTDTQIEYDLNSSVVYFFKGIKDVWDKEKDNINISSTEKNKITKDLNYEFNVEDIKLNLGILYKDDKTQRQRLVFGGFRSRYQIINEIDQDIIVNEDQIDNFKEVIDEVNNFRIYCNASRKAIYYLIREKTEFREIFIDFITDSTFNKDKNYVLKQVYNIIFKSIIPIENYNEKNGRSWAYKVYEIYEQILREAITFKAYDENVSKIQPSHDAVFVNKLFNLDNFESSREDITLIINRMKDIGLVWDI